MKKIAQGLALLMILNIFGTLAHANNKCMDQAQIAALKFVRKENKSFNKISADKFFFHSEEKGVLYYGVLVDADGIQMAINVGLSKASCQFVEANYVGDDN